MNDTPHTPDAFDLSVVERLHAVDAEARQQTSVISAAQQSHAALLQRHFDAVLRLDRLERRLGRLEETHV